MMKGDSKEWARRLQAREQRGEELSVVQKKAWREALRVVEVPAETAEAAN